MNEIKNTEKRVIINEENYNDIKELLVSADHGSIKVGLSILEEAEYKRSEIYILCLLKEAFQLPTFKFSLHELADDYPILFTKTTRSVDVRETWTRSKKDTQANGVTVETSLSYRVLYDLSLERDNPIATKFIINLFKDDLVNFLQNYGFSFLEYLDIEIKPKKK